MKFNGDLIGFENPSTKKFVKQIPYTYNSFGHRCKELNDIDLDNYILFTGCSHTEGHGLHLEHTYPYLTARQLNCDYYNLGLAATGFDILFYNLMTWLNKYPKPNLLVIQYPDMSRYSAFESESSLIVPYGPWSDHDHVELLLKANECGLFLFRNYCNKRLLSMFTKQIPTIKLVFGNIKSYDEESIRIDKLDYAIDNLHYGIETHTMCSEIICQNY
jgi:hypothetical protein